MVAAMIQEPDNAESQPFDPARHGFVLLPDYQPPGGVKIYECRNHAHIDGRHNHHRLNGYLSQDGEFVTIWFGLLDGMILESLFLDKGLSLPDYNEGLFRGHIESEAQASQILKALRPSTWVPQILRSDPSQGIVCEILD